LTTRSNPDPCACCADECGCQSEGCSGAACPVDLSRGIVEYDKSSLKTVRSGNFRLTWYNQWNNGGVPADYVGNVGNNWAIDTFATVSQDAQGDWVFVWTPGRGGKSVWFSQAGAAYVSKYGARQTLTLSGSTWRLTDPDGKVWEFDANSGLVSKMTSPGGQVTDFIQQSGRIVEKRWSFNGKVEARVFSYLNDRVSEVILYRGTTATPHQTAVRRALLVYYDTLVANQGNVGDLKTVYQSGWQTISTSYYRYYTAVSSIGYVGGLKYIVEPSGYLKLSNPNTASDSEVADVASKAFQYNSTSRRVTRASTNGGAETFDIAYTTGTNVQAYNNWQLKAVATQPDGSTLTVFANHVGQDLLRDHQLSSKRYIEYFKYNNDGRLIQHANPSAINLTGTPYNETSADLNVQLNASLGLIQLTTYYGPTATAPGYPELLQVKKGSSGTPINLSKTEYEKKTVGTVSVYKVTKTTAYRSDTGTGDPLSTEYVNTFHSGTVQLNQVTTKLPDVPTGQNGGTWLTNNTRVQVLNIQNQLTQSVDAKGTKTDFQYDASIGTQTQMLQDSGSGKLNLATNTLSDEMGRPIRVLDPSHVNGAQNIRSVEWTVYLDDQHEVRSAQGYLIGTSSYTLINPVTINRSDASGRPIDQIVATRGSNVESAGELTAADTFPQSSWTTWTNHSYGDNGRLLYTRVYHSVPTSGSGSSGTNYDQTDFGYDSMGRQNRTQGADGTITRQVFDIRGLVTATWIGTNDNGATDNDPSGGGAAGNNMKPVTKPEYDGGQNSGDGNLTKITSPVDNTAVNDRVTKFEFDWRNRQTASVAVESSTREYRIESTLNNLGQATLVENKRNDSSTLTLTGKTEFFFDNRNQQYRNKVYAVSDTGVVGNALESNQWFDANGANLSNNPSGSQQTSKTTLDAVGRAVAGYVGYPSSLPDNPTSVTGDVVFSQTATQYDAASNILLTTQKMRWHNATGNGALNGPSAAQPKSRDSYIAFWQDGIGRGTAVADYGTNNNAGVPTRPSSAPSSSSGVLLLELTRYNPAGLIFEMVDEVGKVKRSVFDHASRPTSSTKNFGGSPVETVQTTYAPGNLKKTETVLNTTTGSQTTEYFYGVTLSTSGIASNNLISKIRYPDNSETSYKYNRQGQKIEYTDANGNVHQIVYDALGAEIEDRVTTLGTNVDGAVRRVFNSFDTRRRSKNATAYSATTGGTVTSDIQNTYNSFNQPIVEYQQHGSAVSTSTSPKVQIGYADGSNNTVRPISLTYPNGNKLDINYGTGANDKLSRPESLTWKGTLVANFQYIGLNYVILQTYLQPATDLVYSLATGTGSNPYAGLDQFGRIIDCQWLQGTTKLVQLKRGYDFVSNPTYQRDETARTNGASLDQLLGFDGLDRLISLSQGQLNGTNTAITGSPTLTQGWTLDSTGNWSGFNQTVQDVLTQTRTHNTVNEITGIAETVGLAWADPAHDSNGNMTTIPQPNTLNNSYKGIFDAWNQLVRLTNNASGNKTVAEYGYDGLHRRNIKKEFNSAGTLTKTRHLYLSNRNQVLEERNDAATTAAIQNLWGIRFIDELILRDRDTNGNGVLDERLYALTDTRFSVVALTNTSGAIQERTAYQPYGKCQFLTPAFATRTASSFAWTTLYTGRELDADSGLYYFRARYYHSSLGRFVTRDPIGYVDGMSLYRAYFVPNYSDPSGEHIYLTKGLRGRWDPVGVVHQDICVDTWDLDLMMQGCCLKTGARCFSFGVGNLPKKKFPGSKTWLGWSRITTSASKIPGLRKDFQGEIYESSPGKIIVGTHKTNCFDDAFFLTYMMGRVGTVDRYTVVFLNCVNYTNNEFQDAINNY